MRGRGTTVAKADVVFIFVYYICLLIFGSNTAKHASDCRSSATIGLTLFTFTVRHFLIETPPPVATDNRHTITTLLSGASTELSSPASEDASSCSTEAEECRELHCLHSGAAYKDIGRIA